MEKLNSKLYEKYRNLKKRKLFEEEEWNQKMDINIRNYELAMEDMIEGLKKQNEQLHSDLQSMQEQCAEYERLFLEEAQKTKELCNEVGRLQNLLSQKNGINDIPLLRSPNVTPEIRSGKKSGSSPRKKTPILCAKENGFQQKEAAIVPYDRHQDQIMPECCRGTLASSGDATGKGHSSCVFQTFIEFLVGMKFSIDNQNEGLSLSVVHQRSGYSFSLTWIRHEDGQEGELRYQVSSLGTLERVALDWMKDDIVFSMTMCPVFFERISRVIGRH